MCEEEIVGHEGLWILVFGLWSLGLRLKCLIWEQRAKSKDQSPSRQSISDIRRDHTFAVVYTAHSG